MPSDLGAIAAEVVPIDGGPIVVKHCPNAIVQTDLQQRLQALGVLTPRLAAFMMPMCVNATAHGAFNLGFSATVVASATATRALTGPNGQYISAQQVHDAALAATRDLVATVVDRVSDLPV